MKRFSYFFFVIVFICTSLVYAKVQSARLAVDVGAGKWKSVKLSNLPQYSVIRVGIKSNGAIILTLVEEAQYIKYPKIQRPLFQSIVRDKFSFAVKIPAAGHYYLVFDNVSGVRDVKLNVTIQGASGADALLMKGNPDKRMKF